MAKNKSELIIEYLHRVQRANKETPKKELFKDLLHRLYAGENDIEKIIDAISSGAERAIVNIPRKDKIHRGSADTLFNKIIIEFENDLKVSFNHAKEQLAGYLLGQFHSGEGYNYTLIVSDLVSWKVLVPDVSQLAKLGLLQEHELILNEAKDSSFTLTEKNAEDFYYWIDRFLFKEEKQKATLKRIEESFGYQSNVFIECFRNLDIYFQDAKKYGEVQVSFEQWRKFLSIAYGTFDASESNFLVHTYLSVFSKMLAYSVISNDDYIDEKEMYSILEGSIFHKYNINNFIDNDFFHWVKLDRNFNNLKKVFRLIAQEISTFDFSNVEEDVLKGVYQELIDLDTRHALGEYYTPDWLCERIVNEFNFKATAKILDPSCGSGSFLRAAIHRIKKLHPKLSAQEINNCIYGIDIHPLSVQIAKTTVILALGKDIQKLNKPIQLNIILANTLLAPEGVKNLFGSDFEMSIDKDKYNLTTQILDDVNLFDDALGVCEELAEQTANKKSESIEIFEQVLNAQHKNGVTSHLAQSFYKIYLGLKKVKEKGRDSIWKFIVQNLYKPYFLSDRFDYVLGNPPWFTFSSIKNEEYQDTLAALAQKYNVKPAKAANFAHLEIAAIFLSYCSSYFLRENGTIAFVLPRSFFSADHHDNTRAGISKGFKLESAWDLNDVTPLFRIPSCVLIGSKAKVKKGEENLKEKAIPSSGLKGLAFDGRLPSQNCNLKIAKDKLSETETIWFYSKQGKSSALSAKKTKYNGKVNPYKKLFKQGATIVPRAFYFVDIAQVVPEDFDSRIINIKTAEGVKADAKKPWKGLDFSGRLESKYLFKTAISRSILPFALYNPDYVALPITVEINEIGEKKIKIHNASEIMRLGSLNASRWFQNAENIWNINRTEKSENMSSNDRIDFQRGITEQNLNAPYLVLYNSSAKDANATIVKREDYQLEFISESKTYVFYTLDINEAYYLTAILNSTAPNLLMKDFQTKGLFGARDVHKKILDIYYPKYDKRNSTHNELAELSKTAHQKTKKYIKDNPPKELTASHLGRLRSSIKKNLISEMKEIDKLVKKILT